MRIMHRTPFAIHPFAKFAMRPIILTEGVLNPPFRFKAFGRSKSNRVEAERFFEAYRR